MFMYSRDIGEDKGCKEIRENEDLKYVHLLLLMHKSILQLLWRDFQGYQGPQDQVDEKVHGYSFIQIY